MDAGEPHPPRRRPVASTGLVRATGPEEGTLVRTLAWRPPLAWEPLHAFLAARATPGVELVEGERYHRTLVVGSHRGWLAAGPSRRRPCALEVSIGVSLRPALEPVLEGVRRLFDLDADSGLIDSRLAVDLFLRPLVRRLPGLRVPGGLDGFELAVRAVLGQQVSVRAATTLAGRLAGRLGEPARAVHPGLSRFSVTPDRLASDRPGALAALGLTRARAECLIALARAAAEGSLRLEPGGDGDVTLERLRALPGIGEWTAQYVAMRALRAPDAFPHTDLGLRKALGSLPPRRILAESERWRPWRAYAAMHLWASLSAVPGQAAGAHAAGGERRGEPPPR